MKKTTFLVILVILLLGSVPFAWSGLMDGKVTTLAGTGIPGFSGDGGPASSAQLNSPGGVFIASDGTVYIADTGNHAIRKVDTKGVITTIAGTGGKAGFSGDGGPATQALLNSPEAVMIGPDGLLYIADTGNHRIRVVDANGNISTLVGSQNWSLDFGEGRKATEGMLGGPSGFAFAPNGNLIIAEAFRGRLRQVDKDGFLTTLLGSDLFPITPVALLQVGNVLYVADVSSHRIYQIVDNRDVFVRAGTGRPGFSGEGELAYSAALNSPGGVAVDPDGNLFIADTGNHRVRMISPDGVIRTVVGTGRPGQGAEETPSAQTPLRIPENVALGPDGRLYIAEAGSHRVRVVDFKAPGMAPLATLSIPNVEASIGGSATFQVVLGEGTKGFKGAQLRISFAQSTPPFAPKLKVVSANIALGPLAKDATLESTVDTKAFEIRAKLSLPNPVDGPGVLLNVPVTVDKATPPETLFALALSGTAVVGDKEVAFASTDGTLRAFLRAKGDLNNDGKVNIADAILALRIAVGQIPQPGAAELPFGDLNGDGKIDAKDAIALLRLALGTGG